MHPTIRRTMGIAEWTMLLALSVLWGGSFFFTGVALHELPPLTVVLLRVGLAAVILNLCVIAAGTRMPRDRRTWSAFVVMGCLNNALPFGLIVWGQTHIASGLAALLNAATPLCTVIVAHLATEDETMSGNRVAGVLVGFVGVIVTVGPSVLAGLGTDGLAQLAILGATASYALAGVYGRRFTALGVAPLATAAGQVTASTGLLLPVVLVAERPWTLAMPGWPVCGAVLAAAALSTALAYVLYFRLLRSAGATNLLLVTFLVPISAIALGWLILGERLEPRHGLGMLLIGVGLAAIDGWLLERVRLRRPASKT